MVQFSSAKPPSKSTEVGAAKKAAYKVFDKKSRKEEGSFNIRHRSSEQHSDDRLWITLPTGDAILIEAPDADGTGNYPFGDGSFGKADGLVQISLRLGRNYESEKNTFPGTKVVVHKSKIKRQLKKLYNTANRQAAYEADLKKKAKSNYRGL